MGALLQYRVADDDENFDDLRNIPPPQFTMTETPFPYNFEQNMPVVRVRVRQPDGSVRFHITTDANTRSQLATKLVNRSQLLHQNSSKAHFEDDNILFYYCMQTMMLSLFCPWLLVRIPMQSIHELGQLVTKEAVEMMGRIKQVSCKTCHGVLRVWPAVIWWTSDLDESGHPK